MKSGFVGIIGRPNVGKSSLLNTIMGKKIAITSNKPQTTRNNIQGIYNDEETQMVFVDTPGSHKPKNKLGKLLNKEAYFSMNEYRQEEHTGIRQFNVSALLFKLRCKESFRGDHGAQLE